MKKLYIIKRSKMHGKGLFAKCDIEEGTKVVQYRGKKITKSQSDKIAEKQINKASKKISLGQVYIFTLNKKHDIDGNYSYNTARLINHSCYPNCETDIVKGKIWIISTKKIKKGEEITYDYGFEFDKDDYEEHICKCGLKNCIGYIVISSSWKKLAKHLKKNGKTREAKRVIRGLIHSEFTDI